MKKDILVLKPLTRTSKPQYPTREVVQCNPSILCDHIPHSWLSKKSIAVFFAFLAVSNSISCSPKKLLPKQTYVAPVFIHGEGRGSLGCVVGNPPQFLSEEDARQIIEDEFSKSNLEFPVKGKTLKDIYFPFASEDPDASYAKEMNKLQALEKRELKLDGYNKGLNLGYEYISEYDYYTLGGLRWMASAKSFDFPQVAKSVANEVKKDGRVNMAIFYDPFEHYRDIKTFREEDTVHKQSEEDLRQQIRDFLEWAKHEGLL